MKNNIVTVSFQRDKCIISWEIIAPSDSCSQPSAYFASLEKCIKGKQQHATTCVKQMNPCLGFYPQEKVAASIARRAGTWQFLSWAIHCFCDRCCTGQLWEGWKKRQEEMNTVRWNDPHKSCVCLINLKLRLTWTCRHVTKSTQQHF